MVKRRLFAFSTITYRKLLVSYTVLLMLPLLVSIIVYAKSVHVLSNEIGAANMASLIQTQRIVDGKIGEFQTLADQLSLNDKVERMSYARDPVTTYQRLVMYDIQKILSEAEVVNDLIDEIYIYLPKSGYILSNVTRYKTDNFENIAQDKFNMSTRQWEDMILTDEYRNMYILEGQYGTPDTFVFTQKLFYNGVLNSSGVIVILAKGANFMNLLDTLKWNNEGQIIILSQDGKKIVRTDEAPFFGIDDALNHGGAKPVRYGKKRYFIDSITSNECDWRYIYMIPSDEYMQSIRVVERFMLIYLILCIIAGIMLSLYFAKRNYTPIHKLTRLFLDKLGQTENKNKNEVAFLEETLQGLLNERSDLSKTIKNQTATVRNGLLVKLVQGNYTKPDVLIESCRASGVTFLSEQCMLLGIVISEDSNPFFEENSPDDHETRELINFMIKSVIEELTAEKHSGHYIEALGLSLCLITFSTPHDQDPDWKKTSYEIISIAERTRKLFTKDFGIYLSFAVSNVYDSLSELPEALSEVTRVIDHIVLYGENNTVIHASSVDMDDVENADIGSSMAILRSIASSVQMQDFAKAKEDINIYVQNELMTGNIPIQAAKIRMAGLVNTLFDALLGLRLAFDEDFWEELNIMDKLFGIKSVNDLQHNIDEIFSRIIEYLKIQHDKSTIDIDSLINFIKENYNDNNLSVGLIAEKFNVSLPHLSRWFKKETGIGLLDYINLHRVQNAKQLIIHSDISIQDIAIKVGFGSRNTLVRAFKRYEGKPPSNFR